MTWKRASKSVTKNCTTITYSCELPGLKIESKKKKILHSNPVSGNDTWEHTTYFVVKDGKDVKECWTFKAAKEYAAKVIQAEASCFS